MQDARRDIRDVVSAYVDQLQHGCGNEACDEILCATGRRNRTKRPVRNYTARSARITAIAIASGPNPRAHLCQRYRCKEHHASKDGASSTLEPPRDPSSFEQLLSDTQTIRNACRDDEPDRGSTIRRHGESHLRSADFKNGLTLWRRRLNDLLHGRRPSSSVGERVFECLAWLTSNVPEHAKCLLRRATVAIGDAQSGQSWAQKCIGDAGYQAIVLRDYINHEPSFRLFILMLEVLGAREDDIPVFTKEIGRRWTDDPAQSYEQYLAIVWLKMAFLRCWNGDPCMRGSPIATTVLLVLESLQGWRAQQSDMDYFLIPKIIHSTDAMEMVKTFLESQATSRERPRHILELGAPFTISDKAYYFRHLNHLRMRDAHSTASVNHDLFARVRRKARTEVGDNAQRRFLEDHYLLLNVSRARVVEDAFDQLWHRRKCELLRPLRVRLGEMDEHEVGQDLGGVQLEFFNLVCKEIFKEELGMFFSNMTTGYSYFRPGSLQPLYKFELCGLLFGLALYNGLTIPVSFPWAFYAFLIGKPDVTHPQMVAECWPTVSRSLKSLLATEIGDLDAELPLEANGLRLSTLPMSLSEAESQTDKLVLRVTDAACISEKTGSGSFSVDIPGLDWPGWQMVRTNEDAPKVNETNKQDFVHNYIAWLIIGSVLPQWRAFMAGFFAIIDPASLRMLSAYDFRNIMEGSKELNIAELRAATVYDEPYKDEPQYIQDFWTLISSWPQEKQKQLVKFVTAAERIPAAGASSLTFKIQGPMHESIDALPTSSTCFGVLTLPEYPDVETLDRKLTLALEFGLEGFGTG